MSPGYVGTPPRRVDLTEREEFVAIVDSLPLLRADAAVVLCGEDGEARAQVGAGIMQSEGAGVLLLSGGVHDPERGILGAEYLKAHVLGAGVAPSRIKLETESTNTYEQAQAVIAMAKREGWQRLLIVASPYHVYRAFLTFVRVLVDAKDAEAIQVIPVSAAHTSWFTAPPGTDTTRLELLRTEFEKIDEYRAKGHAVGVGAGISYLKAWDARQWDGAR